MDLPDWLERLERLHPSEIELGLERVTRVFDRLCLDCSASVLHVAGTNGKGSSTAMLEAVLRESGQRTGSYFSPHLVRYNERIRIDGAEASDAQIVAAFERVDAAREGETLTYFEFGTLAAWVVFVEAGVDAMILEIGMGGRLDAVNAIEPTAGLITNIGLDHCAWLGDDIDKIAFEKAGIMRRGKPLVFGSRDVPEPIITHAAETGALLLLAGRDFDWRLDADRWHWQGATHQLDDLVLPVLAGPYQIANAAGALALLEAAGETAALDPAIVSRAMGRIRLEGRAQVIGQGPQWLLDVAHNPAAAEQLGQFLQAAGGAATTIAIVGMLDDKDVEGVVAAIAPAVDSWIAVTADSSRAIAAGELARRIANAANTGCLIAATIDDAMDRAEALAEQSDRVLVTGSFRVVGPALNRLYSRRKTS